MRRMMIAAMLLTVGVGLSAQTPATPDLSTSANPELIGLLTKEAGVTPA